MKRDKLTQDMTFLVFLTFLSSLAWSTAETPQELILKKQRKQAILLLQKKSQDASSAQKKKYAETIHQYGTLFLTDQGQKFYEQSQSTWWTSPESSTKYLQQAEALEDENLLIDQAKVRNFLFKDECAKAQEESLRASTIYNEDRTLLIYGALADICLEKLEQAKLKLKSIEGKRDLAETYIRFLLQIDDIKILLFRDANFPEVYYWQWKKKKQLGLEDEASAKKYHALCQNVGRSLREKYFFEPKLCARLNEVPRGSE